MATQKDNSTDEVSTNSANGNTRRQFVAGSAGALGGMALGGAFVGSSLADEHGEDDETDDDETENGEGNGEEEPVEDEFEDDVDILNYALTLELLEARFYAEGLDNIGEDGLCNCEVLREDSALAERAYDELRTIQEHEEIHAETLRSVIVELGGEPVEEPEFDFGMATQYPMAFLATAAQLEDVGVSAYAGAAPFIENADLVPPALAIHSVEARHASFLRTLTNETGFPEAFDEARSKSEVLAIASDFIVDMDENGEPVDGENGEPADDEGNGTDDEGDGTDDENGTPYDEDDDESGE